jgi:hypothetical protein
MTGEQNYDLKSVTLADVAAMVAWWKSMNPAEEAPGSAPVVDTVEGFMHVPPMYREPVVAGVGHVLNLA